MKRLGGFLGTLLLGAFLAACGGGGGGGDDSSSSATSSSSSSTASTGTTAIRIDMIGDSTMANYEGQTDVRPRYGWGEKLAQFFNSNVTVNDWAASGRSSRSFYNESGKWDTYKTQIQSGDYVIIQFGHNDQKYGDDYAQYGTYAICSDPAITDGESCTGNTDVVDSSTTLDQHSYYQYLKLYVTEIRAAGGIPILMTPVVRHYLTDGVVTAVGQHDLSDTIKGTESNPRGNYPAAMKAIAEAYSVPIIDLTADTKTLIESFGADRSASPYLYYPDDTHLNELYATLVAKMAVDGLEEQGILTDYLSDTASVVSGSSSVAFDDTYIGATASDFFNIGGFNLSPSSGTLTVTAPSGFYLSTDNATWSSTLSLSYTDGALAQTVYVEFVPTSATTYSDAITIALDGATMLSVPVSGTGLTAIEGDAASGLWSMMSTLTGTATGDVSVADAILGSGISEASSTTSATIDETTYTGVNRYVATGISAADETRYLEFDLTASGASSSQLVVTGIDGYIGGSGGSGVYVDITYSTDSGSTWTTLKSGLNAPSSSASTTYAMTSIASTLSDVTVAAGGSFRLRVYPYYKDTTSTGKYLSIANVSISGVTQ